MHRIIMILCALESPDLGQPFKYLERYHGTRGKSLQSSQVSAKTKLIKTQKFRQSQLAPTSQILYFQLLLTVFRSVPSLLRIL